VAIGKENQLNGSGAHEEWGETLSGRPTLAGPPKIARVSPELTEWKAQGSIQTEVPNRSQVYCKTLQGWVETGERKAENSTDGKTYMWVEDQVGEQSWKMGSNHHRVSDVADASS